MKAEIYIFGNFADGYSQYPDNYTRNLFKTISSSRRGASEMVFHREGSLTYYIYMREISRASNTFIGLCYVFNDIIIKDFAYLFGIFEDAITNIVVKGELLEFANDGNLITKVNQLYTNTEELQRVSDYLNSKISSLGRYAEKLPSANFAVSNKEWKTYSHDDIDEIRSIIGDYSNIRVIKGENYDTKSLKGYAAKLKSQDAKINSLRKEIEKLKLEKTKLLRQKKQYTYIIVLVVLIAIGVIYTVFKINSKNETIQRRDDQIAKLETHRNKLQMDSLNLTESLNDTKESLRVTNNNLEQLRKDHEKLQVVKDGLVAANESLEQTVEQLNNKKSELERTVSDLKSRNSELERTVSDLKRQLQTNSYSSSSFNVGSTTSRSLNGHDNTFALWLNATKNLKINCFYVHPDKSGYITIGLYSSYGSLISSCRVYVTANQWNKISPDNFVLNSGSKYYFAIKEANGISLGYHNSSSNEYSNYKTGSLQILGSGSKGKSDYGTKYYQYFYNINYSLKN